MNTEDFIKEIAILEGKERDHYEKLEEKRRKRTISTSYSRRNYYMTNMHKKTKVDMNQFFSGVMQQTARELGHMLDELSDHFNDSE